MPQSSPGKAPPKSSMVAAVKTMARTISVTHGVVLGGQVLGDRPQHRRRQEHQQAEDDDDGPQRDAEGRRVDAERAGESLAPALAASDAASASGATIGT